MVKRGEVAVFGVVKVVRRMSPFGLFKRGQETPCCSRSHSFRHGPTSSLKGSLRPDQRGYKVVEIVRVDVADGNEVQVLGGGFVDSKAGAGARECEGGTGGPLHEKDGDLVFVDGEEKQGCWLAVEVGEVRAFEGSVGREICGVGEVEAEGKTALKPGFDGVAIGGDDLWSGSAGESGEVLVEEFGGEFGGEGVGLMQLAPAEERDGEEDGCGESYPGNRADWVDARRS